MRSRGLMVTPLDCHSDDPGSIPCRVHFYLIIFLNRIRLIRVDHKCFMGSSPSQGDIFFSSNLILNELFHCCQLGE